MPPRSLTSLKTDRAQLLRALDDLRSGKLNHLGLAERGQLAGLLKQRLEETNTLIKQLEVGSKSS